MEISWHEIEELKSVTSHRLIGCCPAFASCVLRVVEAAALNGLRFAAFQGLRSWEQQAALYAQGRTAPGKIVTNARPGESWHNFGLAADLVEDGDSEKAGIQWSWQNNADYLALGKIVSNAGLGWGGLWKSIKDYPHAELTGGTTLEAARTAYQRAQKLEDVWALVEKNLPASWPKT